MAVEAAAVRRQQSGSMQRFSTIAESPHPSTGSTQQALEVCDLTSTQHPQAAKQSRSRLWRRLRLPPCGQDNRW